MRLVRLIAILGGLNLGLLLIVYGFFLVGYHEAGWSGTAFVRLNGEELDAELLGIVSLAIGLVLIACAGIVAFAGWFRRSMSALGNPPS